MGRVATFAPHRGAGAEIPGGAARWPLGDQEPPTAAALKSCPSAGVASWQALLSPSVSAISLCLCAAYARGLAVDNPTISPDFEFTGFYVSQPNFASAIFLASIMLIPRTADQMARKLRPMSQATSSDCLTIRKDTGRRIR
jgi:hypothetical protein